MQLVHGVPGDLCIDTDAVLDGPKCALLVSKGVKGVFRYLSDISTTERDIILAAGLKLFFVNHSRGVGWVPSAAAGALDAQRDLVNLKRLSIPIGVHVLFDLEGVGGGKPQLVMDHVNAHAAGIQATKNLEGVYVGAQALLDSHQLYSLLSTLYWHSCSRVVDINGNEAGPQCGWAIYQLFPDDVTLTSAPAVTGLVARMRSMFTPKVTPASVRIDWNVIQQDFKGRVPIGVAA